MEGYGHRSAFARVALAALALVALGACSSAPQKPNITLTPTLAPLTSSSATTSTPTAAPATDAIPTDDIPDSPTNSKAIAINKPLRGSTAPVGAIVFGTDVSDTGKNVTLDNEKTTFPAGHPIAWRVTLPTAVGGESVRVTLTTADGTETPVDEFVAQTGWNVYYGNTLSVDQPGTYVLHYLVDGHEVGSGTFKVKAIADLVTPTPVVAYVPPPTATPAPAVATPDPTPAPTKQPKNDPQAKCIAAYPDFCIKVGTPDLDCPDLYPRTDFTVLPPDPMRFDADHDGIGCES